MTPLAMKNSPNIPLSEPQLLRGFGLTQVHSSVLVPKWATTMSKSKLATN